MKLIKNIIKAILIIIIGGMTFNSLSIAYNSFFESNDKSIYVISVYRNGALIHTDESKEEPYVENNQIKFKSYRTNNEYGYSINSTDIDYIKTTNDNFSL